MIQTLQVSGGRYRGRTTQGRLASLPPGEPTLGYMIQTLRVCIILVALDHGEAPFQKWRDDGANKGSPRSTVHLAPGGHGTFEVFHLVALDIVALETDGATVAQGAQASHQSGDVIAAAIQGLD